jgi:hypothetical protein
MPAADNGNGILPYLSMNVSPYLKQEYIMRKLVLSLSFAMGLAILGWSQGAVAGQQTTTRTGPNGNSQVTTRIAGNGQQTTTRTGPNGNSQVTTRTAGNGQQTTTRTGPNGNSQVTTRTAGNGQQTTIRTGPNGNSQTTTRTRFR